MIIDPYHWHRCRVDRVDRVAVDTVAVRLERPDSYRFKAGQYAVVRTEVGSGRPLMRQYSFSSPPDAGYLELLVQHEPGGEVSTWFAQKCEVGDVIDLSQPFGSFTLQTSHTRPLLFIAGRVGIAPLLSMIRSRPDWELKLIYSVRSRDQVCYFELIRQLQADVVVTGESSRIDAEYLQEPIKNEPLIYVCGSKGFVEGICALLAGLGVPDRDMRRESFTLQ